MKTIDISSKIEKPLISRYSLKEEIANSITHGVGVLFSIVTLTILLVYAIWNKSPVKIVSFSVYGVCSICLYLASTLYHSFRREKLKKIFRIMDHSSIYLCIAGTYTPITLLCMKGIWGFSLLTAVWTMAIAGILFKIFAKNKLERYNVISVGLYIAMGWLLVIAIKPMLQIVPIGFLMWILAGGLFYTIGVIFYMIKKIPYNHAIWHAFVLGGSIMHFEGIFLYLR